MSTFSHAALLYADTDEYVDAAVSYVCEARKDERPVLVAVPGYELERIRAGVGVDDEVTFWDAEATSRNPGRIIPALLEWCARHADRRVALLGQPMWVGRTGPERSAVLVHEALVNRAMADVNGTALCPYDTAGLPAEVVADARRTHPVLAGLDGPAASADFAPDTALAAHNRPLTAPVGAVTVRYTSMGELRTLRQTVAAHAAAAGLSGDRAADLEFVVTELATNTLRHATGAGTLHLWTTGDAVVCQVGDGGVLRDPLVGRRPVTLDSEGGRGLLLTHQMCDLVETCTSPSGTTIRVHIGR